LLAKQELVQQLQVQLVSLSETVGIVVSEHKPVVGSESKVHQLADQQVSHQGQGQGQGHGQGQDGGGGGDCLLAPQFTL
jgi:hypothetical protein